VAEIALTLVLAFAAGLLLRNLIAAQTADPGFVPEHVLALELVLPSAPYKSPQAIGGFYDRLEQDLHGLPGVTAVGAVNCPPSVGDCGDWFYSILDRLAPQPSEVPIALFNTADDDYFGAMHIPLREGRAFNGADLPAAPRVAIVNEAFARNGGPRNRPWAIASSRAARIATGPSTKSWGWPAMSARWAWAPNPIRKSTCLSRSRRARPWW
jgi:putative ABC transport system permease protein